MRILPRSCSRRAWLAPARVPASVEVHLIDRPGLPWLGSGECGQGPAATAIANAVARASGTRRRNIPLLRA